MRQHEGQTMPNGYQDHPAQGDPPTVSRFPRPQPPPDTHPNPRARRGSGLTMAVWVALGAAVFAAMIAAAVVGGIAYSNRDTAPDTAAPPADESIAAFDEWWAGLSPEWTAVEEQYELLAADPNMLIEEAAADAFIVATDDFGYALELTAPPEALDAPVADLALAMHNQASFASTVREAWVTGDNDARATALELLLLEIEEAGRVAVTIVPAGSTGGPA